jgi:hypothetical protein
MKRAPEPDEAKRLEPLSGQIECTAYRVRRLAETCALLFGWDAPLVVALADIGDALGRHARDARRV